MAPPPRYLVGIDLGTTHTVVAYADSRAADGGVAPAIQAFEVEQLIAPGEVAARPMLPSARYHLAEGELPNDALASTLEGAPGGVRHVVGQLALALGEKVPGRLILSAKSWLSHGGVDRTAPILPWGAPADVPKVSPVDASASYLAHVRYDWDRRFPKHPLEKQEVVLTVPASFDEAARALTLVAARSAGLSKVRLVEEPQAAFYCWLDAHRDTPEEELSGVRLVAVVDVGGGTTDLTLLRVELRDSGPRITRIAVGEHLMLGGDNMDLAIARAAEPRLGEGKALGAARFLQLVQQSRAAKERLLSPGAPASAKVTVLGSGGKLVGGARSTEVTREEVRAMVLDGFFPKVGADARPEKRRGGIVEFGLPYVADPAVTRHLAEFLARHDEVAREALEDRAPAEGTLAVPDTVLFNGGVFRSAALAGRVVDVLGDFRGKNPGVLTNPAPELGVAHGAVAYGLARRGLGLRIGGGSARSYFLVIDGDKSASGAPRQGVCVLPRGAEEGEELRLAKRTFSLRTGRPVRFHLVSSTADAKYVRPGDLAILDDGDRYHDLPPIAAVLEADDGTSEVPVRLITTLTEVGTLDLSCVHAEKPKERWKLEFQLRGKGGDDGAIARRVTQLHPRFREATARISQVYGKSSEHASPRVVKSLRTDLERLLGPRDTWDSPLLRELFGALLAGAKRRRRSKDHERVWFNLVGYTLRPGFGYPLDEWRMKQLTELIGQGVQFVPEAQNWSEWWTLLRRVAGGLDAEVQERLLADMAYYLEPPSRRPRKRPRGPKKLGYDDMVRLAGSLERLPAEKKAQVGGWLVARLEGGDENPQTWWAVGRLGARVPFYGSAHRVVSPVVGAEWLSRALAADLRQVEQAAFAAALIARVSGDRQRDLPPEVRERAAARLSEASAPASWVSMVREVTHLDEADERRIFGESLPPGLRLLD